VVVVRFLSFSIHFKSNSISSSGAFLIPYFILYFLIGAPIYYLELALGQFSSRGPATAFILAKGWQGNNTFNK
jgi:SNF family Na+-dependent transporter